MKQLIYAILLLFLLGCNAEGAPDCIQTTGEIIQVEMEIPAFHKIVIHKKIELIISEGPTQQVIVETGENLLPDISLQVVDNELIIDNYNECNFVRDYGVSKVYITAPNITEIRNASEQEVSSIGTLTYPNLYLRSTGEKNNFLGIGDFKLTVSCQNLIVWSNGLSNFYLDGSTDNLTVDFTNGDTRFEGANLAAQRIKFSQISSNDMVLFPVQSIEGSIHSTGDVILYNTPASIAIEKLSIGNLIMK